MEKNKIKKIEDIASKLWTASDELRGNISAEQYMHIIVGIIFLKTISDKYEKAIQEIKEKFPNNWEMIIRDKDMLYAQSGLHFVVSEQSNFNEVAKFASQEEIGEKLDEAFMELEKENKELEGAFDKSYNSDYIDKIRLGKVLMIFSEDDFSELEEDLIGRIYEYFLGNFFKKLGQKGGEFYTPKSVVELMVDILDPQENKSIYDPACGTGGMFVQAKNYLKSKNRDINSLKVYGQEFQQQTWKLAKVNLLLNNFHLSDTFLGNISQDTFKEDLHKNKKFDYVLANPPFNLKKWTSSEAWDKEKFPFGNPPAGNANYAWLSLIVNKLNSQGKAAVVLANGSLSSSQKAELEIRKKMLEENKVDAIIALPDKLFYTTGIPAAIWIFNNNKKNENVLMINADSMGSLETKKLRFLETEEIEKISGIYKKHNEGQMVEELGFAKSVTLEEIKENDYSLVPGRYVGFVEEEIDKEEIKKELIDLEKELSDLFDEFQSMIPDVKSAIKKAIEYSKDEEKDE